MAEITLKKINQVAPNAGLKMVAVNGTTAADGDIITVTGIQTIQGCVGFSTTGVAAAYSTATNVITVNNAGALTWNFLVWGY
jgi:predicted membrane GTPase involved in stress response